ncbi:MAG: glycogen/starch/alpha-glucan phosphorylase [Rhodospirillaceae bacterium]|nr:glycogen/starch/alpha-glucan phosphorylase [Rhodospirillaceae bacterium]
MSSVLEHDPGQDESRQAQVVDFQKRMLSHLTHTVGKGKITATERDWYHVAALTVRDLLVERWMESVRTVYANDYKRVYYLSLEFLLGRSLVNNLLASDRFDICREAMGDLGLDVDVIAAQEPEAALGNGGLGRLAACLLDSMAAVGIPGYGYGIRYDYGMFSQYIGEDGQQLEMPDDWLRYGNRWEFPRPELTFPVRFYGRVEQTSDERGRRQVRWLDTDEVSAMAYDQLVAGYGRGMVNNIRLWAARSLEFDLKVFNRGDYIDAVRQQQRAASLSRVLYPDDSTFDGKTLRLKQEYFFVSASLQDIVRRFRSTHENLQMLPYKVAIQLNDTHPAIAVAELMRILMDDSGLEWPEAWDITVRTFSYTNHTLMPEALETWPVSLFEVLLPRHLQIIYEINYQFLDEVRRRFPGDHDLIRRVSLIDEGGERRVRMAHLAFVGSHRVNGVAQLHTTLMKSGTFADLHRIFPQRIVNQTNGITPRRWLNQCNRPLAQLITDKIGHGWARDLRELRRLERFADDPEFRKAFRQVKRRNKERLAQVAAGRLGLAIDPDSLFDVQVKRIHEYKRQLLNVLHVIARYNRLKADPSGGLVPRTVVFAGKAASGYAMAKLIIRLVNDVAERINNDPAVGDRLKVMFLPNYNVSLAEIIIPAADVSQQISTAGTEASGTGNMKLALNGALTVGTRDGANIEIADEVGEDNVFFFGLTADQVGAMRAQQYDPWMYYEGNPVLRQVLDQIRDGAFSSGERTLYRPIFDLLTRHGDHYLLLADFADYLACQGRVDALYRQEEEWTRRAILNTVRMGRFSSDLTVQGYAAEIWGLEPIPLPVGG